MDELLSAFDVVEPPQSDSSLQDVTNVHQTRSNKTKGKYGVKTECVRVQCRNWTEHSVSAASVRAKGSVGDEDDDLDDELIWWSWNGKLEGFEMV